MGGLTETENITCYELVSAEPVKGWAASVARENFKLGRGEVLQNRAAFLRTGCWLLEKIDTRSMQAMGMIYPYWENAARVTEDRCARLRWAILLGLIPGDHGIVWIFFRKLRRGKEKLEDDLLPEVEGQRRRERPQAAA